MIQGSPATRKEPDQKENDNELDPQEHQKTVIDSRSVERALATHVTMHHVRWRAGK